MKYTVQVYSKSRIDWLKRKPELMSKRQKEDAKRIPETCGALPEMVFKGQPSLRQARLTAWPYIGDPNFYVRIVPSSN